MAPKAFFVIYLDYYASASGRFYWDAGDDIITDIEAHDHCFIDMSLTATNKSGVLEIHPVSKKIVSHFSSVLGRDRQRHSKRLPSLLGHSLVKPIAQILNRCYGHDGPRSRLICIFRNSCKNKR